MHVSPRRQMLLALLAMTLAAGLMTGSIASDGGDGPGGNRVRQRLHELWRGATHPLSGGETDGPGVAGVLRSAAFGPGGVIYVVGGCAALGMAVVGVPFALAVVFWRGFGLGYTALLFVHMYGWRGAFVAAAALGPHNVFNVPGLLLAAGGALELSWRVARVLVGGRTDPLARPALQALVAWTVSAVLLLTGALVEAYVTPPTLAWAADRLLGE